VGQFIAIGGWYWHGCFRFLAVLEAYRAIPWVAHLKSTIFPIVCCEGAKASYFECAEPIQGSLEVVEDDTVRKTFKNKG
jgi:hypothetical protein